MADAHSDSTRHRPETARLFWRRDAYAAFLYPVVIGSGFAGLGYQMAWTRSLSVSLGHEYVAVLAVVTAFFVGLAVGGFALNGVLRRTDVPARWYCALELLIGTWALLFISLLPAINALSAQWMGTDPGPLRHWSLAFGLSLFSLLPATVAMGATLPAGERLGRLLAPGRVAVAGLYASNTIGAMAGTLLTTFVLLPMLGLKHTVTLFAVTNFGIAALVWMLAGRGDRGATSNDQAKNTVGAAANRGLPALLFFTGLLGLGYEVLVVRILSQVLEGTVYSFAAVLTVYLAGTALGAGFYQTYTRGTQASHELHRRRSAQLLHATAILCLLGLASLWLCDDLYQWVFNRLAPGTARGVIAELCVAAAVFLLPTLSMGALFSHLAQGGSRDHGLGRLLGVNTLGAALAPLVFGVVLLPWLGAKLALLGLCLGYLFLSLLVADTRASRLILFPAAGFAVALLVFTQPLRFLPLQPPSEVIAYREGALAAVAVLEENDGSRHLAVNNRFLMGGTASRFSDHRQTHLPLLWHGQARQVLYLGLGTGITLQAAKYYPDVRATGVELIPELPPLMPLFGVDPDGGDWPTPPQLHVADARRFVTADRKLYDVVIAEVFHPSRDGAGGLYTVEHFAAVKERLAPGGLFCQWLPLFQLELDTLRLIVSSFLTVFPQAQMHVAHFSLGQPLLCLLGNAENRAFAPDWLIQRVKDRQLQQQLVQLRLNSDFALFGGYLGGAEALRRFALDVPLNTDDWPRVTYRAPAFVYGDPALPAQRLLELVRTMAPERGSLLAPEHHAGDFDARLQNYWKARDVFLAAGVGVSPSADTLAMLQRIRDPLLKAIRLSPDFMPAYEPLLQMARSIAVDNPRAAMLLLRDLNEANPDIPWARSLAEQISRSQAPSPMGGKQPR